MDCLIIDDDKFLTMKLKKMFINIKNINSVITINDYLWFINIYFSINIYDVILLDINLNSNKNWIDILRLIRRKNLTIPIIIFSWNSNLDMIDLAFKNWASDYIIKPFRFEELKLRVLNWYKNRKCRVDYYSNWNIYYNWLLYYIDNNDFLYFWEKILLTKTTKRLLYIFLYNKEKLISNDFLLEKLYWYWIYDKNLRIIILRLKKSLLSFWLWNSIENIRWEWYIFKI